MMGYEETGYLLGVGDMLRRERAETAAVIGQWDAALTAERAENARLRQRVADLEALVRRQAARQRPN